MIAHKNIHAAFVAAKREFGPALKSNNNPAFRSKYADLGACLEAVDEALLNNGIALIQETSEDASGATVETVFLHESGQERRCGKLHVPASKQDAQGYGSALTYARRYSVMAACGIAPEDDDGNAASGKATSKPTTSKDERTVTEAILTVLRNAAMNGTAALQAEFSALKERAEPAMLAAVWKDNSESMKKAAAFADPKPTGMVGMAAEQGNDL